MTEEKTKFGFKVLVGLWHTKTFVVLISKRLLPKLVFLFLFAQCRWGCLVLKLIMLFINSLFKALYSLPFSCQHNPNNYSDN